MNSCPACISERNLINFALNSFFFHCHFPHSTCQSKYILFGAKVWTLNIFAPISSICHNDILIKILRWAFVVVFGKKYPAVNVSISNTVLHVISIFGIDRKFNSSLVYGCGRIKMKSVKNFINYIYHTRIYFLY